MYIHTYILQNDVFLRAITVAEGLADSRCSVSGLFTLHAHPPHCDPNGGSFENRVEVEIKVYLSIAPSFIFLCLMCKI